MSFNRLWFNQLGLTFSLGNVSPLEQIKRVSKCSCLILTHSLRRPPSPEGRGLFWMRDSATSPFGSEQNDSVSIGMSESFLIRETKLKGV